MSKIIDFFKIIGAKSSVDAELSQEEVILNATDLTKEQKKILLDAVKEANSKKIDIDSVVHAEARRAMGNVQTTREPRRISVNKSVEKDEELTK